MKTIYKKDKTQFNLRVNEEEFELIKNLRENYAINISGCFKIFLKELKVKLQKIYDIK
jgi:hypothetical protein